MVNLATENCVSLTGQESKLTEQEIENLKANIFGWDVVHDGTPHLCRTFKFSNFSEAINFAEKIGERADEQDHHPRLTVEWGKVKVEWWSHALDGLHRNDFIMAAKTDALHDHWREVTGEKDKVEEASEESFPASDSPAWKGARKEEWIEQQYGSVARMDDDEDDS